MSRLDQIADLEKRFLLPTYNRYPIGFERGKGVFLYDFEGKKYLDFVAGLGVNALGHAHPRIVKAIREQAARVIHLSNLYYNEYQGQLAERLCQLSGLDRVFFSNSGTEAMEGAIKLARLAGHKAGGDAKSQLVALQGSYHGRTFGAMSLTGQDKYRKGFEPLLDNVTFVTQNNVEALQAAVNANTCAIVLEPIFGEGGILECSEDFLRACREGKTDTATSFNYGARLTEFILLGNLAQHAGAGKKVQWNGPAMEVTNLTDLNRWVKREHREGWRV